MCDPLSLSLIRVPVHSGLSVAQVLGSQELQISGCTGSWRPIPVMFRSDVIPILSTTLESKGI